MTFHDGKPVTSADVAFSVETAVKHHHLAPVMFRPLEKVETPDPYTVVFKLKHPYPAFMAAHLTWFVPILPKRIYAEGDFRKHPANLKPVGSGPFKFGEWKKGQYITLERNENYFRKGRPYLDRIIIEFIPDPSARALALETGKTHIVWGGALLAKDARRLEKMPQFILTEKGYEAVGLRCWFAMNLRKPPLNNIKVRKAIAHALDKDFIAKEFWSDFGKSATGPFRFSSPFYNPNVQQYGYDLDKANQLLDEAGYRRGADGIRFDLTLDDLPASSLTCEHLRENLKKIGINCTLRRSPDFSSWSAKIGGWDYEIMYDSVGDFADPVIGIERMYVSSNIKNHIWTNTMGYVNPEVDRLFAEAQVEQNFEKRRNLYHRVQEILVDELPIIWVQDVGTYTVYSRDCEGLPVSVWGLMNPLDTVYLRAGKSK